MCDFRNDRLQVFTSDLVYVRQIGSYGNGDGQLQVPIDVTHDRDGNLYVADRGNRRVQVFTTQGKYIHTQVGKGVANSIGIATDGELVYIAEQTTGKLLIYHKNGRKMCSLQTGSTSLWGVAVDQDGFVYVCDSNNHRVIVF